jgi:outer membrane protein insertion porin family
MCSAKPARTRFTGLSLLAAVLVSLAAAAPSLQAQQSDTLCNPQILGNRRIPKETILARMFSRAGDPYDAVTVERDFNSLWNTGYFEDVRIEREDTPKCVQLIVVVREKPTIREITYPGLNAVSQSDLLDRFKKEKVGLTVESQ